MPRLWVAGVTVSAHLTSYCGPLATCIESPTEKYAMVNFPGLFEHDDDIGNAVEISKAIA